MPKKTIIPHKTPMPEQAAQERTHNFQEVAQGYTLEQAREEARRCLLCPKPGCIKGCPAGVDIPAFVKAIADGNMELAIDIIKRTNSLPAVTGRVCPQETQCEVECVLSKKFESVAIGRLERFAADWQAAQGPLPVPEVKAPTGKKVAVVGSGPAGLTAAADLTKMGHSVTIFEALHEPGGVLVYGIPEFRLPKEIVRREVEAICAMGALLVKDFVVGTAMTVDELLEEFDAVFLGTGAGLPWFLRIPGEDLNGIYSANEYLSRANLMKAYLFPEYDTPIAHGKRVVTVGAGNVAMDAARTALRLGAEESIILYRRTRAEMPARAEEIEHAEQEGIQFIFLTAPVVFHGVKGRVAEIECIKNELGEPDASGRRRPVQIPNSNFRIPADIVIIAAGQNPGPLIPKTTPDLEVTRGGVVVVEKQTLKTSKRGVFAGGDIATGGATVILAIGQARQAALAVDEYLRTGEW